MCTGVYVRVRVRGPGQTCLSRKAVPVRAGLRDPKYLKSVALQERTEPNFANKRALPLHVGRRRRTFSSFVRPRTRARAQTRERAAAA